MWIKMGARIGSINTVNTYMYDKHMRIQSIYSKPIFLEIGDWRCILLESLLFSVDTEERIGNFMFCQTHCSVINSALFFCLDLLSGRTYGCFRK